MAKVEFDTDVEMPMYGFCVVIGTDMEGEQLQDVRTFGDVRLWNLIGLAESASEEFRMQLRRRIEDAEDED